MQHPQSEVGVLSLKEVIGRLLSRAIRFARSDAQKSSGSSGVSGGYTLAFAATRFAASTSAQGAGDADSCHNSISHQELGLLWAIQPPETPEEPKFNQTTQG